MLTPEQAARQVLRTLDDLKCLRTGGVVTYRTLAAEIPEKENLDLGLRHAVSAEWLKWTPNAALSFVLTEAGYHAGAEVLT